jgi:DNA processing protein
MDREELAAWLRLTLTPGVGPQTGRRLLAAFGLPQQVFTQSHAALEQVAGAAVAAALRQPPTGFDAVLARTLQWLQQEPHSRAIVTLGDARYPAALLHIDEPALLLYLMGRLDLPWEPARSLAIVGSRNPTPQGAQNARLFARALAEAGLTIVSGLALGIDGAAHEGALESAPKAPQRLATVAVVGTGLDRVYPRSHHALAHRIAAQGLLVSEYPLGTPPLAANFPRRNRLIAGLSRATLVVEAALQSGSLITARLAAEQGKDVFAIPGSIHATQARGCHALIRQGAKLVESAQDVLEELGLEREAATFPSQPPQWQGPADEDGVLTALGYDPVSLDVLQARTGWDTARLQARLLELELAGEVARLPGGLLQRLGRA